MENGIKQSLTEAEVQELYRKVRGTFLQFHRTMVRLGLVSDKERIQIFDLTNTPK